MFPEADEFHERIESFRKLWSIIRLVEQVLREKEAGHFEGADAEESRAAKSLVILRPDHETAAVRNTVQQAAPPTYDIHTKDGRAAMLDAYKAECKASGVKVGYIEMGRELDPTSIDPETIVNKWRALDPRYEGWTPAFRKMFAEKPHLRKQPPSRTAG
jgi:hypothetical protein